MFHPFQIVHYNTSRSFSPKDVLAPPYDVLSDAQKQALKDRSPYNFAHVDVPQKSAEGYAAAAKVLQNWLKDGILVREQDPAYILYELTFKFEGAFRTRLGIMGVLDLAAYSEKRVLPHERTLAPHKDDRLALMRATHGQLSPIFVMTHDPRQSVQKKWPEWIKQGRPLVDVTDADGFRHIITLVYGSDIFSDLDALMESGGRQVMIVDGHHRYETALAYSQEMTAKKGLGPWNRVLTYLTVMEDPDLLLLPTHRCLHSVSNYEQQAKSLEKLLTQEKWTSQPLNSWESCWAFLKSHQGQKKCFVWVHPTQNIRVGWIAPDRTAIDVVLLHDIVLQRGLGISKEQQAMNTNLRYVSGYDAGKLDEALRDPTTQALFLTNPCIKQEVFATARAGETMPQKSTFFYPKILSGTALYLF